jgi:hypothetical protein
MRENKFDLGNFMKIPTDVKDEKADNGKPKAESKPQVGSAAVDLGPAAALAEFNSLLTLTDQDRDALWRKRGLDYETSDRLGFKSNLKSNKQILIELEQKYGIDVMLASGLWQPEDRQRRKERRPNAQFFGMGIIRKAKPGERLNPKEFVDEDGNLWGWCNPILIGYFDDKGLLIGLRPHKGGASGETLVGSPKAYFPRDPKAQGPLEIFHTAIITEGEFKGAALWETVGLGRTDKKPALGVAALPGISFGKNYNVRQELDEWLRRVQCVRAVVIFDNEEKSDPALAESYKEDWTKRHEARKYARYLAMDLHKKLHIRAEVGTIPNEYRNERGKADWDGVLAAIALAQTKGKNGKPRQEHE